MYQIAQSTITAITMMAQMLPTFRAIQLAHRNLCIDVARNFHVRVRFRTLDCSPPGTYQYAIHGRPDGICMTTYSGQGHTASYSCNGISHGTYQSWYLSGAIAETFTVRNDRMYGEHKEWYPDGQLKSVINYVNDIAIGLHKEWNSNGTLHRHCINLPLT